MEHHHDVLSLLCLVWFILQPFNFCKLRLTFNVISYVSTFFSKLLFSIVFFGKICTIFFLIWKFEICVMKLVYIIFNFKDMLTFIYSAGIFAVPDYLNKEVVSLLCIMLQVDPLKRATISQIRYAFLREIIQHKFLIFKTI